MRTAEQQTTGPDNLTRELTRDLADLCKRDGAMFAKLVREADAVERQGGDRRAFQRERLDELGYRRTASP